jgi:protein-S-isoprenylcysteine O-methyltransferase Ste14
MHLLGPIVLGVVIWVLLGALVIIKHASTGSVLDKPGGPFLVQLVNIFNLFFLLIVNPVAAIALLTRSLPRLDPTHVSIAAPDLTIIEILGLILYIGGFGLMAWALLMLGRNYQLGGSTPRSKDQLIQDGPYRSIRHPMYTAALSIALGLACLIQSAAFLAVFVIYLILIVPLVRLEEQGLVKAYGPRYAAYQQSTKSLVPIVW